MRFSPNPQNPVIVSAGWDKLVKVREAFLYMCDFEKEEKGGDGGRGMSDDAMQPIKYLLLQSLLRGAMRQTHTSH